MRISDWSSDVCSSDLNYKFDKIRNRALFGKRSRRNKKEYLKKMREWRASNPVCITCHKPFDEAAEEAVAKAARHPLMPGPLSLGYKECHVCIKKEEDWWEFRSEERRGGKECVGSCGCGWWPV